MMLQMNQNQTVIVDRQPVSLAVSDMLQQFTRIWWECSTDLPDLGRTYSLREQLQKEKDLDHQLDSLFTELRTPPQSQEGRLQAQKRIMTTVEAFARAALGLEEHHIQAIKDYGFIEVLAEFARSARAFDPSISDEDLFQAGRNVWSMNFMQLMLGQPIRLTPSIFAYSLLYPYTDNYLDDPTVSDLAKHSFNDRFRRRLDGDDIQPLNPQEERICRLIEMIEEEFDRHTYPQVYESLLAIFYGQAHSLSLIKPGASPFEMDVLGICFEKGGTSVLADGYLVIGDLTPDQQAFMFHYGTLTQLMDDLEDTRRDLENGLQTVFSMTAQNWPLDQVTNRTIHYAQSFLDHMDTLDAPAAGPFKDVFRTCLIPVILGAVGTVEKYYSRSYRRAVQSHFPVRFSFIEKQRRKLVRRGISAMWVIEAMAEQPE